MTGMVPAVDSALRILAFVDDHPACSGAQVHRGLGLNPSTCHGVLKTLTAHGYLDFDPSEKTYRLGPALGVLGRRAWSSSATTAHLQPFLRNWNGVDLFTVFLARPLPGPRQFVVVDKIESSRGIKVTVDLGERFPMSAPALGKAFLAWSLPEVVADFFRDGELEAFTAGSITSPDKFREELDRVRERGWAESRTEYYADTNAVSAAVVDPRGEVYWVVCGLASSTDMPTESLELYGRSIHGVAQSISQYLTGRAPSQGTGSPLDIAG